MARGTRRATVEKITEWSPVTRSLFLRLPSGNPMRFAPGQFVSIEMPVTGENPLVRAYSIASSPAHGGQLEICVDRVPGGRGSEYLFGLSPGAAVDLNGPFGSFTVAEPPGAELVFIADGTGIAPIRAIVESLLERGGDARLVVLHGARGEGELLFRDEFESWMAGYSRLHWEPVMAPSQLATGENPPLERLVKERYVEADEDRSRHFWVCAVGSIVRRLRDELRGAGYARKAVRYEQW